MAFFTGWTEVLQAVRVLLSESTIINSAEDYQRPTGTLDYLLNPSFNPRTIQAEMVRQSGASEFRNVQIRYQSHRGEQELVTTDAGLSCAKNDRVRDLLVTVTPDLFVMDKFTLYEDYMRENKESGLDKAQRIAMGLRRSMRVCRESMSSQLLSKLAGNFGSNPAQGTNVGAYTSFQAISSTSGVDINNFDIMVNDQMENFMQGPIGVIGFSGNPRKYFNRLAVGNLNTNAGVNVADIAQQFGALFFQDYSSTANLGNANRILAFYPGLAQFFNYDVFGGVFAHESPGGVSRIRGSIPDTIYPFNWSNEIGQAA